MKSYRKLYLYRRRLAGTVNECRQDGGDTIPLKAVKFKNVKLLYIPGKPCSRALEHATRRN